MLSCQEVTKLMSESMERPLTMKEKMAVNMHLMMCRGCKNCGNHMQDIRKLAREYARGAGDGTKAP